MPFDLSTAVPVAEEDLHGGSSQGGLQAGAASPSSSGFDLSSAVPVTEDDRQYHAASQMPSPGWWQRLTLPQSDPNSVENSVRRVFGAPAVGANQEFEKVANADMPFPDVLPTAAGAGLAQAAAREGGGIGGVGAAVGKGALDVVGSPIRYLLRGDAANIPAMRDTIDTFKAAGATPSVGQATQRPISRVAESAASKVVGGYGVMQKAADAQASQIGSQVSKLADRLSKDADPFNAGLTIEKGLKGPGGFMDRFKQGQRVLYDKLDSYFRFSDGSSKSIKLPNTIRTLEALNPTIAGAPQTSRFFKNAEMQDVKDAVLGDVNSIEAFGQRPNIAASNAMVKKAFRPADMKSLFEAYGGDNLPYEAVKKIRTLVGEKLDDFTMAGAAPRSQWRSLYRSLSQDLDDAAHATGDPEVIKAMKSANAFTAAGHEQIDNILDRVVRKGASPEQIFEAATNPASMRSGATKISGVMSSLKPAERDVVASAVLRRMGLAKPGAQNAEGDVFSTATFLSNWSSMSSAAKDALFSSGTNAKLRPALDSIAKAAENIKAGSKIFANPSGTAPSEALIRTGIGLINPVTTVPTLVGMGAAHITARMMTNPKFVDWLAQTLRFRPEMLPVRLPALLNVLKTKTSDEPESVREDTQDYIQSVSATAGAGGR